MDTRQRIGDDAELMELFPEIHPDQAVAILAQADQYFTGQVTDPAQIVREQRGERWIITRNDDGFYTARQIPELPDITEGTVMNVRNHHGFGHGVAPGETRDLGCTSCTSEDRRVPGFGGLSVSNVDRQPHKVTYWLAREIEGRKYRDGRVIQRESGRTYLSGSGETVENPHFITEYDAAVDSYATWEARHAF